jgi:hypothetical protein
MTLRVTNPSSASATARFAKPTLLPLALLVFSLVAVSDSRAVLSSIVHDIRRTLWRGRLAV